MYDLIGNAKMNDIDPEAWLADVLRRINDHPASGRDERAQSARKAGADYRECAGSEPPVRCCPDPPAADCRRDFCENAADQDEIVAESVGDKVERVEVAVLKIHAAHVFAPGPVYYPADLAPRSTPCCTCRTAPRH